MMMCSLMKLKARMAFKKYLSLFLSLVVPKKKGWMEAGLLQEESDSDHFL